MKSKSSQFKWLACIVIIVVYFIFRSYPLTKPQRLNKQCRDFGTAIIKKHKELFDGSSQITFFYSNRLDTCVKQEIDELGNEYFLCDVKRNYIKQDFEDPSICGLLFECNAGGVNNVVLAKVEKYKGRLFKIPYTEFIDDGEGNVPGTLKTPIAPFTRDKCERMFNKKLSEIK